MITGSQHCIFTNTAILYDFEHYTGCLNEGNSCIRTLFKKCSKNELIYSRFLNKIFSFILLFCHELANIYLRYAKTVSVISLHNSIIQNALSSAILKWEARVLYIYTDHIWIIMPTLEINIFCWWPDRASRISIFPNLVARKLNLVARKKNKENSKKM